jgi:hypothetical protein
MGVNGGSNESLISLAKPGTTEFPVLGPLIDRFATHYVTARLPDWYYQVMTAIDLHGLYKNEARADIRPIAAGNVFRRAIATHQVNQHREATANDMFPVQIACGARHGGGVLTVAIREHLVQHPTHHGVNLDVKNCFNSCNRNAMILSFIEASPGPRGMGQVLWAEYRHESSVHHQRLPLAEVTSKNGGQQGDGRIAVAVAYAMLPHKRVLHETLAAAGGFGRWQSDDGWVVGPPDVIYAAIDVYEKALEEKLGLVSRQDKYGVYVSSLAHDSPLRPPTLKLFGFWKDQIWQPGFKPNGGAGGPS